jgi:hypothetical protein
MADSTAVFFIFDTFLYFPVFFPYSGRHPPGGADSAGYDTTNRAKRKACAQTVPAPNPKRMVVMVVKYRRARADRAGSGRVSGRVSEMQACADGGNPVNFQDFSVLRQ